MHILGLDPGKTGGMALLSSDGRVIMYSTWQSIPEMFLVLGKVRYLSDLVIGMEKPNAFEKATQQATFNFGFNVGAMYGFAASMGAKIHLITPNMWTDRMHATHHHQSKGNPKKVSFEVSQRLFPGVHQGWAEAHTGKLHDGIVDALLIAEYTRIHLVKVVAKESMTA